MRPGYKQTEVGWIPNAWGICNLGDLFASVEAGVSVNSLKNTSGSLLNDAAILKTSCVLRGRFFPDENKQILPQELHKAKVNPVANSLVFSRMNTPDLVGECGHVPSDYPSLFLPDRLWLIRLKRDEQTCARWLAFILTLNIISRKIKEAATGTSGSMKNISKSSLFSIKIPVVPVLEQRAIAQVLSDTDALIESLEQLIAKKRQIKQGAMQELLTGKRRLPGFRGEWEKKRFGEVVSTRKERTNAKKAIHHEFYIELEHIESATGQLIGSAETGNLSSLKSIFRKGDVLFGKLRAYLRKYWLADQPGVCSTEIWVLIPLEQMIGTKYLFQLIQTERFIVSASSAYGTHMPRSDWNIVKNFEFLLPSLQEQNAIASILSDIDAEISSLQTKLAKYRQIKQGMMQELLTGRIRLV